MIDRRRNAEHDTWTQGRPANQLGLIFPSWIGTIWDPSLIARQLADAVGRDANGKRSGPFAHVATHTLRRTAITRLDEAGMSTREIAVWAGHTDPSLTQKTYMARNIVSARPAEVLHRAK